MGDRLATIDMDRRVGGCCDPFRGEEQGPDLTQCRLPTSVPSGILIHPTVWPQYTNVTDRQDRQTDMTDNGPIAHGEPLLVTVV